MLRDCGSLQVCLYLINSGLFASGLLQKRPCSMFHSCQAHAKHTLDDLQVDHPGTPFKGFVWKWGTSKYIMVDSHCSQEKHVVHGHLGAQRHIHMFIVTGIQGIQRFQSSMAMATVFQAKSLWCNQGMTALGRCMLTLGRHMSAGTGGKPCMYIYISLNIYIYILYTHVLYIYIYISIYLSIYLSIQSNLI